MKFEVTLRFQVEAESSADALDIGMGAGEHLLETFNDDGSLEENIAVESKPLQPAGAPA
jgi:hypothetical protein